MKREIFICTFILFLSMAISVEGQSNKKKENQNSKKEGKGRMDLEITNDIFNEGEIIPDKYTCSGEDISPPLNWSDVPEAAQSLALICDDPDAPGQTWVHWVIYNIPVDSDSLNENVPTDKKLKNGILQGENDFGQIGYGGPCPPPGPAHRYLFKLYALDKKVDLSPGASKEDLLDTMEGHIIAQDKLMGKFSK